MFMNKQTITTGILVLVIIGLISQVIIGSQQNNSNQVTTNIKGVVESVSYSDTTNINILYWGTTCPHCHDTIDWIKENKIDEKITVVLKEVYENQQNSLELTKKAKSCGMNEYSIGLPLMYTIDGNCLIGTPDITQYLSDKTGGSQ